MERWDRVNDKIQPSSNYFHIGTTQSDTSHVPQQCNQTKPKQQQPHSTGWRAPVVTSWARWSPGGSSQRPRVDKCPEVGSVGALTTEKLNKPPVHLPRYALRHMASRGRVDRGCWQHFFPALRRLRLQFVQKNTSDMRRPPPPR